MNRFAIASMLSVAGLAAAATGQTLTILAPAVDPNFLFLNAMSADGATLVGQLAIVSAPFNTPTYYQPAVGTFVEVGGQDLTTGIAGEFYDITANGRWATGTAAGDNPQSFFAGIGSGIRYDITTGEKLKLPDIGTGLQSADGRGITSNGQTIVGRASPSATGGTPRAVYWTVSGATVSPATLISAPAGVTVESSRMYGISDDGATAVGVIARAGGLGNVAFVVSPFPGGTPTLLPDLVGGNDTTSAEVISSDGSTIIGQAATNLDPVNNPSRVDLVGTVWRKVGGNWVTAETFPASVPGPSASKTLKAVNSNGTIIYGEDILPGLTPGTFVSTAVVWNAAQGERLVRDVMVAAGIALGANDRINSVEACSADGLTITGRGTFGGLERVFIATLPNNPCPNPSNVAGANQSTTPDDALTADDIIVFLGWYFANDSRADVAGPNQSTTPDNALTADDIIVFLGRYFSGC